MSLFIPLNGLALENLGHAEDNGAKVLYKSLMKVGQTMEASDLVYASRSRPFTDGLDFVFIHMDALSRNYKTQEDNLGCEEMALLKVTIKLLFS